MAGWSGPWLTGSPSTTPRATWTSDTIQVAKCHLRRWGGEGVPSVCFRNLAKVPTGWLQLRLRWRPCPGPSKWDKGRGRGSPSEPGASELRDDVWVEGPGEAWAGPLWLYALGLHSAALLDVKSQSGTNESSNICPWSGRATVARHRWNRRSCRPSTSLHSHRSSPNGGPGPAPAPAPAPPRSYGRLGGLWTKPRTRQEAGLRRRQVSREASPRRLGRHQQPASFRAAEALSGWNAGHAWRSADLQRQVFPAFLILKRISEENLTTLSGLL